MFRGPDGQYGGQDENHKEVKLGEKDVKTLALWIDLLVPFCGDYVEANQWTVADRAQYEYYWAKRVAEDEIDAFNVELKRVSIETGDSSVGKDSANIEFGGLADRQAFMEGYVARRLPSIARRSGDLNVYRREERDRRQEGEQRARERFPVVGTEFADRPLVERRLRVRR